VLFVVFLFSFTSLHIFYAKSDKPLRSLPATKSILNS
jgi:hypothetical protein